MQTNEIDRLRNRLAVQRESVWAVVRELGPEGLNASPLTGWSGKDILAHIAFAESVNVKFARLMLEHAEPVQVEVLASDFTDYPGPFSLDEFNAYMFDKLRTQSLDQVLVSLERTRVDTLNWIDTLSPEQLDKSGEHAAWGNQTVRGMLKILLLHDKTHAQELRRLRG